MSNVMAYSWLVSEASPVTKTTMYKVLGTAATPSQLHDMGPWPLMKHERSTAPSVVATRTRLEEVVTVYTYWDGENENGTLREISLSSNATNED